MLTIKPKINASIRDLVIRNGRATRIPNGGGISNKGRLTLRDVVVRDNRAVRGGGIYNDGALRMLGRSVVRNNGDLYVAGAALRARSTTSVVSSSMTAPVSGTTLVSHPSSTRAPSG